MLLNGTSVFSVIGSIGKREPESEETKIKSEVDKLWKIRTTLIKREMYVLNNKFKIRATLDLYLSHWLVVHLL